MTTRPIDPTHAHAPTPSPGPLDARATWERYAAAWRATTRADKLAALATSVAPACTYRDPLTVAEGHEALVEYMLGFHQQVPGGHFETVSFITHHQRSVATWTMRDAARQVIGDGISYGEYADDGKLVAMTGFFAVPGAP
jgi:SnoaL-like domain